MNDSGRHVVSVRFLPGTLLTMILAACAGQPLEPWTLDAPPLALLPASTAGVADERGRFREVVCTVLEARREALPHYQPCEQALTRLGVEPPGTGTAVPLRQARRHLTAAFIPGIGWECIEGWLQFEHEFGAGLESHGYGAMMFRVDGLSGSENNARQIRDQILASADTLQPGSLVLIGYSKGAPDALTALVEYPEIRPYVAAMVSVAGAIGGSPLANEFTQDQVDLMRHVPDAKCSKGDGEGLASLRPAVRRLWLQQNPLPQEIPYYSLVTLPDPQRISSILKPSYRKLSQVDPRNDSQMIFFDQVIPGSVLLGYLNADHWAVAVPIADAHPFIGRHFVDHNQYPREALAEALMRYVEEDLARRAASNEAVSEHSH